MIQKVMERKGKVPRITSTNRSGKNNKSLCLSKREDARKDQSFLNLPASMKECMLP